MKLTKEEKALLEASREAESSAWMWWMLGMLMLFDIIAVTALLIWIF